METENKSNFKGRKRYNYFWDFSECYIFMFGWFLKKCYFTVVYFCYFIQTVLFYTVIVTVIILYIVKHKVKVHQG